MQKTSRSQARAAAEAAARAVCVPDVCDVAVVGGGAAGLAAAIVVAEADASVVALERDLECGRKILATGNGRCNFSNESLGCAGDELDAALGAYNDPTFVRAVVGDSFGGDVLGFFEKSGLAWASEEGRLYPLSRQAASVRDVLLARARRAGVVLAPAREVWGIEALPAGFVVRWEGGALTARRVVLATGGGQALAESVGLASAPCEPVLCPLACTPPAGIDFAAMDGRRSHAVVRLLRAGVEVTHEAGEVLFRDYGISGIVAFDLSRHAQPGDALALDLTGGMPEHAARERARAAGGLAGLVDPVIARALHDSLDMARGLRLSVVGKTHEELAQVMRGGLSVDQFDPATLEARAVPGLFAAGEALDVDAACGGYNLAWAWKSGMVAGTAAAC